MAKLVDATDSKSVGRKAVGVRVPLPVPMKRIERRIFRIGDEIDKLVESERLAREELVYHEHLDDDARRDAAVSGSPLDRADARETSQDVARARRVIEKLVARRLELEERRRLLVEKLGT